MEGKIIEFIRKKDFKFIEEIGQGGTGRTVFLEDEIINERFICKKYSPFYPKHQQTFFNSFKDEIKLLHLLYHKNIVRVFNYYLYPENYTGYILMEFIKRINIYDFLKLNPDLLNNIFLQTIDGFAYLEENKILHRDIRPDNILVSSNNRIKIIDFGFGKKIDFESDFDKSISLNWRYTPPSDFKNKTYDFRTEIYFVGKLFEEIIKENGLSNFSHQSVLDQMLDLNYDKRIKSFFDIQREITTGKTREIQFTPTQKTIYQDFANKLSEIYSKINSDADYVKDINKIITDLEEIYRNSMLEYTLQDHSDVAKCFIKGEFQYYKKRSMDVSTLNNFLYLIKSVSKDKQKIIFNNLWKRFDSIERVVSQEDLPF